MKILIKTPFENNNKYIPHLLEHCLLSPQTHQQAHQYWDIDGSVRTGYTEYEFSDSNPEVLFKILTTPPSQEQFILEEKIIKKELRWVSFWQKYFEKILQKVYHSDTKINQIISLQYEELIAYHKRWYNQENMLIISDNWELIKKYGKVSILNKYKHIAFDFDHILIAYLCYQNEKEVILETSLNKIENVLLLDFFSYLLDDYFLYVERKRGRYPENYLNCYITDKNFLITREVSYPKINMKEFKTFFESFSQYFIQCLKKNKKRHYIPHIALLTNTFVNIESHLQIIEKISFPTIKFLLEKFKL